MQCTPKKGNDKNASTICTTSPAFFSDYTKVIIVGGWSEEAPSIADVEVLDTASAVNSCDFLPDYPEDIAAHAAALYNGKILACGGVNYNTDTYSSECNSYDPETNAWIQFAERWMCHELILDPQLSGTYGLFQEVSL